MTVQKMQIQVRNESAQPIRVAIIDRPIEIVTTSLAAAADQLPPMSLLTTYLADDEVIVLTAGGMAIQKRSEE